MSTQADSSIQSQATPRFRSQKTVDNDPKNGGDNGIDGYDKSREVNTPLERVSHARSNPAFFLILLLAGALVWTTTTRWSIQLSPALKLWTSPTLARASHVRNDSTLDVWIESETIFAWNKLFEQVGAPAGAYEGLVIASPSVHEPDYFYTWTRDSAIVTGTMLHRLLKYGDTAIESNLRLYAYSQAQLQKICNPSGCFDGDAGGLGEPKFHVNGTAFTGSWGRPQRDGPALRAITLVDFAIHLLDRGRPHDSDFVTNHLYKAEFPAVSVIKADLEYVAKRWHESSFDLWEEIDGYHFFTFLVSKTALEKGAKLAARLGDGYAASFYAVQAALIDKRLYDFISTSSELKGVIYAALNNEQWSREGLDAAVLLGVMASGAEGAGAWSPANDSVLATIKVYTDSFRNEYKINSGEKVKPVATGRYAEDIYDGVATSRGNPWYLTTLSVSHVLSLALSHFVKNKANIIVTDISQPFWAQFKEDVVVGQLISSGSDEWKYLLAEADSWSDGFWEIVRRYQGVNGHLSEQFNRDTGKPQGARHLTWSYAALVNAADARTEAKKALGSIH